MGGRFLGMGEDVCCVCEARPYTYDGHPGFFQVCSEIVESCEKVAPRGCLPVLGTSLPHHEPKLTAAEAANRDEVAGRRRACASSLASFAHLTPEGGLSQGPRPGGPSPL